MEVARHGCKTLLLDFDGVLHSYTSGWRGSAVILDLPVPGAMQFIKEAIKYYNVAIYSVRSENTLGIGAMMVWLATHLKQEFGEIEGREIFKALLFPSHKPAAVCAIDDRAIRFDGTFDGLLDQVHNYKTWMEIEREA